jgi:hypothetical protein
MKNSYQQITIAGQTTALVAQKFDQANRVSAAQKIMQESTVIEQVGFLDRSALPYPTFTMMGGELSLIGSLAAGFTLLNEKKGQVTFKTSGVLSPINVKLSRLTCSLQIPTKVAIRQAPNRVSLGGISFLIINRVPKNQMLTDFELKSLQELLLKSPAAGIVFYQNNRIYPVVKVAETNTLVWESACGSGSVAFYLVTGCPKIKQPSGEILTVSRENDTLQLSVLRKDITYET